MSRKSRSVGTGSGLKDELHGVFIALLIVQQLDAQAQRPVVKTVFRGNGFKEVQGFLHVLVVFVGDGGEVEMHLVRRHWDRS